jgi:hypothetical protein
LAAGFSFNRGGSSLDSTLAIWTNNTERARFDPNGSFFIGSLTAPFASANDVLVVNRNQNDITRIAINNQNQGTSAQSMLNLDAYGGGWRFAVPSSTNNQNPLVITNTGASTGEKARFTYDGSFVIGGTSAVNNSKLVVNSSLSGSGSVALVRNSNSTGASSWVTLDDGNTKYCEIGVINTASTLGPDYGTAGEGYIRSSTSAVGLHLTAYAGSIRFSTSAGSEKMRLNAAGNLLIGRTTEDSTGLKLQINGGASLSSNLVVAGSSFLGGSTAYTNNASSMTLNYLGSGSVYGITMRPTTVTSDSIAINFLPSTATPASAVAMSSITHKANNTGMDLSGPWTTNGNVILTSGNIGSYNAGSATKLATARLINGVAFDGTSDISIAAGASSNGETYNRQFVTGGAGYAATYLLLAALPISTVGTYDSCIVEALYGGWESNNKQSATLYFANRNVFTYSWETFGVVFPDRGIRAYQQADGSVLVYGYVTAAVYSTFAASVKLPLGFTPSTAAATTTAPTGTFYV